MTDSSGETTDLFDSPRVQEAERAHERDNALRPRSLAELFWLTRDPPPLRALLRDSTDANRGDIFLPRGRVGMLVAPGGTGKTMALLQLGVSVAAGLPWLGRFVVDPDAIGRVIVILGEEDDDSAHRRIATIAKHLRISEDPVVLDLLQRNFHFLSMHGRSTQLIDATGNTTDTFKQLQDQIGNLSHGGPLSMLAIDPAARFMGPNSELESSAATRFVQLFEPLTKLPGRPSVLMCHHATKNAAKSKTTDQGAARGSSALTDGVRWQANLTRCSDTEGTDRDYDLELTLVKANDVKPLKRPVRLKRLSGGYLRATAVSTRRTPAEDFDSRF